jgi:hypothetical protein
MKEVTGFLAFCASCLPGPCRGVNLKGVFGFAGVLNVEFDENAVARRIGKNFQRQLSRIEPFQFTFIGPFCVRSLSRFLTDRRRSITRL